MEFNYEKLGIKVNFSEKEKAKIREIKARPDRVSQNKLLGWYTPPNNNEPFIRNKEMYLKMVREELCYGEWKPDGDRVVNEVKNPRFNGTQHNFLKGK